jgi:Hydrazine synthase alpha subunit middle domain
VAAQLTMKKPLNPLRGLSRAFSITAYCAAAIPLHAQSLPNPVMFVTQVPVLEKKNTVTAIGGNHLATTAAAPRGGDLMIRYPDGSLKNLTRSFGYGEAGFSQGASSIAVRDPHVHWSGQRALFSMVVGTAPTAHWQIYEITGLGRYDTPVITRVFSQPAGYNNVQPCYTSTDNIIFVSDRPRDGSAHLYPARDEEGRGEINTGLWQLNPAAGILTLMEHSPSGSFDPFVDSYGRVVFSRWDHLQRDELVAGTNAAGGFDYSGEAPGTTGTEGQWTELYPEPLPSATNPLGLKFDQFLPWTVNQDGTDLLTINHLGRHEMTLGFNRSLPDGNLEDFRPPAASTRAGSFLQIRQAPSSMPGRYVSMDAVFTAVSAGKLLTFLAPPSRSPATGAAIATVSDTGLARDPFILTNGRLMASVSPGFSVSIGNSTYGDGGSANPPPLPPDIIPGAITPFKITVTTSALNHTSPALVNLTTASTPLNPDTVRTVRNVVNGQPQDFDGSLWELQPVEVTSTTRPPASTTPMDRPELEIFQRTGVSPTALRTWMTANDLAVISARNVTTRDAADKQQPTSLKVAAGVETIAPGGGPVYTVSGVQFFQADYVRGYGLSATDTVPDPGRRVTARIMHDDKGANPVTAGGPGHVNVAPDGSMAAFVPARRGLSWHLADPNGNPVVRERYWLSFQAGEIRSCTSCHGVNSVDQAGHAVATNPPEALRTLLDSWKQSHPESAAGSFRVWSEATLGATLDPAADNDNDGVSNLVEYAGGSSPLTSPGPGTDNSPMQVTHRDIDGQLSNLLTFGRSLAAFGLEMTIESSTDLTTWSEAAYFSSTTQRTSPEVFIRSRTMIGSGAEKIELTDRSASMAGPRFYRLRIQVP